MKGIQYIAILIAVASSVKYHRFNDTIGICQEVGYDDTKCSGLKDTLLGDYYEFTAGACPTTYSRGKCEDSLYGQLWPSMIVDKIVFNAACLFRIDVDYDYGCSDESRNVDPQPSDPPRNDPQPNDPQPPEIWHMTLDNACGIFEFDDAKCPGLKAWAEKTDGYLPGSCPSSHSKSCDEQTIKAQNLIETDDFISKLVDHACEPDSFATFQFFCGDSRMKTFHKMLHSGLCVYVDVDNMDCPDMEKYLLDEEQGYVRGPCPEKFLQSHCDEGQKFEMDAITKLTNYVLSAQCDWDTSDLKYDYVCEQREEDKCPEECAKAIASDASTVTVEGKEWKYTGFCAGIDTEAKKVVRFDDLLPDACDKNSISKCVGEIYKKCDPLHDQRICPFSDYGFPPLQNCHPTTCAEWKEASETGCGKDLSKCVKDEAQGILECSSDGTPLPKSSLQACSDTKKCGRSGEFCNFSELSDGKAGTCELCAHNICVLLDSQKAREECENRCGEDDCTPNPRCLDKCSGEPKTCWQLEQGVKSSGCAKHCNQCLVDMYNKKLSCDVQSWVDGDSAASLSIFMLVLVAIYQF